MYLLFYFILLFLVILVLFTFVSLKINFAINLEEITKFKLTASWLFSIIKGSLSDEENNLILRVSLFKFNIVTKNIKLSKKTSSNDSNVLLAKSNVLLSNSNLLSAIRNSHIKMYTSYGFEDPSITGMLYAPIVLIAEYLNFDIFSNNPDFNTTNNYITAHAKVSPLFLILNILKSKKRSTSMQPLHTSK